MSNTTNIHLKYCPSDVKKWIEDEQARMKLFENKKLKQEFVVYDMLREWYHLKNKNAELEKQNLDMHLRLSELTKHAACEPAK